MESPDESRRVLIVDDEQAIREMLHCFFETKGYGTQTAGGAEEALNLIGAERPHLVVLDLRLPGMGGLDALKRIKQLSPPIPVLLMTGYGGVDSAVAAMKLGAEDYLTKPLKLNELLRAVERALDDRVRALASPGSDSNGPLCDLMGKSPPISRVYELVEQVAQTDFTVVLSGETGTGKTLVARAIHNASRRASERFVRVDCGSIPDTLIESELFGHERGAFTGADRRNEGYFEKASRGTLFLDEIANLSSAMMRKLLCALEERRIYRIGGQEPIDVDIRVIAASNQDLGQLVEEGHFRRDLFHRLNEFTIEIPPLRQRKEDIPFLADRFIRLANAELGKSVRGLSPESLESLTRRDWPGNVRELRNLMKRAVLVSDGLIQPDHLQAASTNGTPPAPAEPEPQASPDLLMGQWSLKDITREAVRHVEQRVIAAVLSQTHGNKSKAARLLHVDYKTLYYKAKEFGY